MRILTEKETAYLNGNLFDTGFPDRITIFIPTGLPAVYKKLKGDSAIPDYLSIPTDTLASFRQQLRVASDGHVKYVITEEAVETDTHYLKCLFIDGDIPFIFVAKDEPDLRLSKKDIGIIEEVVAYYRSLQKSRTDNNIDLSKEFVRSLFQADTDINGFIKRFIKKMAAYVEQGCGAYYYRDNNLYKLRMVVGDIGGFESFPGLLEQAKIEMIRKELNRDNNFIPVEMWQQDIVFTPVPPVYHFIAEGIQSDKTDYLLFHTVDAELTEPQAQALKVFSELAASIHEHAFISREKLLDNGLEINSVGNNSIHATGQFLRKLFITLHSQLGAGYCVLSHPIVGTHTCYVNRDTMLQYDYREAQSNIPAFTRTDEPFYFTEALQPPDKQLSGLPNMKSEAIIPITRQSGFRVGFPITMELDDILQSYFKTLVRVVLLFNETCLTNDRELDSETVNGDMTETTGNMPLYIYESLSEGYFNQLNQFGTLLVSQLELVHDLLKESEFTIDNSEKLFRHYSHLTQSADEIIYLLSLLKEILPAKSLAEKTSAKQFVRNLPAYLRGVIYSIKERKNLMIRLELDLSSNLDFICAEYDLYMTVLPMLVKLMENCASHCAIRVSITPSNGATSLVVRCPLSALTCSDPQTIIGPLLSHGHQNYNHPQKQVFEFARFTAGWEVVESNELVLKFTILTPVSPGNEVKPSMVEIF